MNSMFKNNLSISQKFIFIIAICLSFQSVILLFVTSKQLKHDSHKIQNEVVKNSIGAIQPLLEFLLEKHELQQVKNSIAQLSSDDHINVIHLIDNNNVIFASSDKRKVGNTLHQLLSHDTQALDPTLNTLALITDEESEVLHVYSPIKLSASDLLIDNANNEQGVLYLEYDMSEYTHMLQDSIWKTFWPLIFLLLIIGFLLTRLLHTSIIQRISNISEIAEKFSLTDESPLIRDRGKDEISKVSKIINELMTKLTQQYQDTETNRDKLLASEHNLKTFLDNFPGIVYIKNKECIYTYVGPHIESMFDIKSEELIGSQADAIFRDLKDQIEQEDNEVLFNEAIIKNQKKLIFQNKEKEIYQIKFPLIDDKGNVYAIGGIGLDLTEQFIAKKTIDDISQAIVINSQTDLFDQLVLQLQNILNTKFVLIAKFSKDLKQATTLAFCEDGSIIENVTYDTKHTPSEQVFNKKIFIQASQLEQAFPNSHSVQEEKAESYIGYPLLDANGTLIGVVAAVDLKPLADIEHLQKVMEVFSARATFEIERLESLRTLEHAQQKFNDHIRKTPVAVVEWNIDLNIESWNTAAEKVFGYSESEILGKSIHTLFMPDGEESSFSDPIFSDADKYHGANSINHNLTLAGEEILCEWFNTLIEDKSGEIIGGASIISDVTSEQKMLYALMGKEQEQREILQSMVDAVITIDDKGVILSFNHSAETLFGYTSIEAIGNPVTMIMPEHHARGHDQYLKNYTLTGNAKIIGVGREVIGVNKSKRSFPMRLSVNELPTSSTEGKKFIGTCSDLTAFKEQEQQLRRTQKMDALGKLTGGIAHDFNNMLGVMLGYCELLKLSLDEENELVSYVQEIEKAGQRGASMTQRLLTFSKGKSLKAHEVYINRLIHDEQDMLQKALTPQIEIDYQLDNNLWPVWVDDNEFQDVLLNLCINAMHAMNGSGQLNIATTNISISGQSAAMLELDEGDYATLCITDTGCGMNAETVSKIFDPFFSTKGEKGTGLGLSQVFGFAKRCNGCISVKSTLEEGSSFTLYLPKYDTGQKAVPVKQVLSSKKLRGTEKLLVVDDEIQLLNATTSVLKTYGYDVVTATNGKEAMEVLNAHDIAMVISDIVMPEMDGLELQAYVFEHFPHIQTQLVTGYNSKMPESDDMSADSIIYKPYDVKELLNNIRNALDHPKSDDMRN